MTTEQEISALLIQEFPDATVDITNDSHKHHGHAQSPKSGNSHFSVTIVSQIFEGLNRVTRHQKVYDALQSLIPTPVHALQLKTKTPKELTETLAKP